MTLDGPCDPEEIALARSQPQLGRATKEMFSRRGWSIALVTLHSRMSIGPLSPLRIPLFFAGVQ